MTSRLSDLEQRLLNGDAQIPLTYIVFDILESRGRSLLDRPYRERRQILERLSIDGPAWTMSPTFRRWRRAI
jgi:ATP-dependent DNA ligase